MLSGAERVQNYGFWRPTAGLKHHPCPGAARRWWRDSSLCAPAEGRQQFSPAWPFPELGAETQKQPWLAEGDPTSSSATSGPPGPRGEVGAESRAHSPLAAPSCVAAQPSGLGPACLCAAGLGSSGSSSSGVTSFIRLWLQTLATSLMS